MFDHIGIGATNLEASKAFFLEALAPLGVAVALEVPDAVGLGRDHQPSLSVHALRSPSLEDFVLVSSLHFVLACAIMVPQKVFFTKGVGIHKEKLASFELALRAAGVAHCNLVLVSSIYPPGCKTIPKEEGLRLLRPGEIVFAVYDRESNNEPNRLVAASVGLAIPADSSMHGYLSEHHSFGETDEKAGEYAEDLAASMLATTLGIEFNPELDWDEREQIFKMSGKIVRTTNVTQSAVGNKDGLWTTVFAGAVFINDDNLSIETGKSVTVNAQSSLQEEVLKKTIEGQLKNPEAHDKLAHRSKEALTSGIEQPRLLPPARKSS